MNRDLLMEFIRTEDFEETLYTLSECDKFECLITIAQSINEEMEHLIERAIKQWKVENG